MRSVKKFTYNIIQKRVRTTGVCLMLALLLSIVACGGGGGLFGGIARVVGQALSPIRDVIDANPIPLGDAPVFVRDFVDTNIARTTEVGRTDANGNFDVELAAGGGAVIVQGEINGQPIRISGLVRQGSENELKNLDITTDVACQAYFDGLDSGVLTPDDLTSERILNLEQSAAMVSGSVDPFDLNSVKAAAAQVQQMTNFGASPPAPPTPETPPSEPTPEPTPDSGGGSGLNCQTSETTCADGFPICAEKFCNGATDCADGSDEDPNVCGEASSCCIATNGCPNETATSCATECCCCGIGETCNQGDFAAGCAPSSARSGARYPELDKLVNSGVYY